MIFMLNNLNSPLNMPSWFNLLAFTLVIVGSINWGLKVLNMNLIEWLNYKTQNIIGIDIKPILYSLIGLSGLWFLLLIWYNSN